MEEEIGGGEEGWKSRAGEMKGEEGKGREDRGEERNRSLPGVPLKPQNV